MDARRDRSTARGFFERAINGALVKRRVVERKKTLNDVAKIGAVPGTSDRIAEGMGAGCTGDVTAGKLAHENGAARIAFAVDQRCVIPEQQRLLLVRRRW